MHAEYRHLYVLIVACSFPLWFTGRATGPHHCWSLAAVAVVRGRQALTTTMVADYVGFGRKIQRVE